MLSDIGTALAGLIAVATILMGARYLLDPEPAAAGFGIPGEFGESANAWLAVKATRDLAIAIVIAILLIAGAHRNLGYPMLAIALIPIADGAIVLRSGGPMNLAYGVHWATAALMLIDAALLIA
jgi:hypothetical protein